MGCPNALDRRNSRRTTLQKRLDRNNAFHINNRIHFGTIIQNRPPTLSWTLWARHGPCRHLHRLTDTRFKIKVPSRKQKPLLIRSPDTPSQTSHRSNPRPTALHQRPRPRNRKRPPRPPHRSLHWNPSRHGNETSTECPQKVQTKSKSQFHSSKYQSVIKMTFAYHFSQR